MVQPLPVKYSKKRSKKVIPTIPEKWKKEFASLAVVIANFILTSIYLFSRVSQINILINEEF
jgi:hypothetical protein